MQLLALRVLMHASFYDQPRGTLVKVSFAPRAMTSLDRLLGQRAPSKVHAEAWCLCLANMAFSSDGQLALLHARPTHQEKGLHAGTFVIVVKAH